MNLYIFVINSVIVTLIMYVILHIFLIVFIAYDNITYYMIISHITVAFLLKLLIKVFII